MHTVGRGFPDLIIAKNGKSNLAEIKDGNKKLTPAQEEFFAAWQGESIQILRNEQDALRYELF